MTVVNNYGNRNAPSIHNGRTNIWNRYHNNAVAKQNASIFSGCCHSHYQSTAPPHMNRGGMFGFPMFNSFGFGISNSWLAGNVIGQTIGLGVKFAPQIGNFFKGLFNKG